MAFDIEALLVQVAQDVAGLKAALGPRLDAIEQKVSALQGQVVQTHEDHTRRIQCLENSRAAAEANPPLTWSRVGTTIGGWSAAIGAVGALVWRNG